MASRYREINIFSVSLLDLLSGALGAVIILFIATPKGVTYLNKDLKAKLTGEEVKQIEKNNEQIESLQKEIENLKKENKRLSSKVESKAPSKLTGAISFIKSILTPTQKFSTFALNKNTPLEGIHFYPGRDYFLPGYEKNLNALSQFLLENPKVRITVTGHIWRPKRDYDKNGKIKYKIRTELSKKRAQKVCDYLANKKISRLRLDCIGVGGAKPLVLTNDEAVGSKNRRVEVKIKK